MSLKWIVFIGLIGALISGAGILYTKKIYSELGQDDIYKTLSSIGKLKKMKSEGAFDFKFTELDSGEKPNASKITKLSDLKGNILLLNFWASWCEPCIQEFPDMIGLIEKRPNVKIVAINRDQNKEDAINFIKSFPEAKGKIFFYWDPKGEVTSLYGTEVLPESYLIGSDFKVLRKIVGIEDWDHPNVLKFIDSL